MAAKYSALLFYLPLNAIYIVAGLINHRKLQHPRTVDIYFWLYRLILFTLLVGQSDDNHTFQITVEMKTSEQNQ